MVMVMMALARSGQEVSADGLSSGDPHVQYSAVSSFVFLRFFAVAVLSPHSFQLRSHHPVSARRPRHKRPSDERGHKLFSLFLHSRIQRFLARSRSSLKLSRLWAAGAVCPKNWYDEGFINRFWISVVLNTELLSIHNFTLCLFSRVSKKPTCTTSSNHSKKINVLKKLKRYFFF